MSVGIYTVETGLTFIAVTDGVFLRADIYAVFVVLLLKVDIEITILNKLDCLDGKRRAKEPCRQRRMWARSKKEIQLLSN